ncbi:MAG: sigma-54-dependent Fis family transcriptional regulator, partial [Deltaproteobacteria bacterium]|nr:sigma-54-dependent Fis family transcriptional regulator [Deltaproteobacteria bacterium]
EGINLLVQKHIDVVLLDLNLPDINGLDVLREIKKIDVQAVVIIITAYGEISSAVEAIKLGAYEYLTKPFDVEDIKIVIDKALKIIGLRNRINVLERQVVRYQVGELITRSRKMHELFDFIDQVAKTSSTVMIYGETGTGKELIADLIHRKDRGIKRPFVTIDCTSLSENLLESELFGHEKGAFTGAIAQKKGLFEIANGGTVFLDEIGELPVLLQSKILKVLESKSFRRVGGEKYLDTDVRIIAATNRDLKQFVKERRFRKDLYYRLNVVPVYLPPLRERREDIFPLIEYFIQMFNKKIGRNISEVSNEALKQLIDYDWPGNIRELRNVIEHMVIVSRGEVIQEDSLPSEIRGMAQERILISDPFIDSVSDDLPDYRKTKRALIENFERTYLEKLLTRNNGNISQCARDTDMHRSSFQRLMRKYGLRAKGAEENG